MAGMVEKLNRVGGWKGGPHSLYFPERRAAKFAADGFLRLDPDGSVWRLRKITDAEKGESVPIKPRRIDYGSPRGHRNFKVHAGRKGDVVTVVMARFVWQMHKGDIPPMMTVNHKDGNPANNSIDNLELLTHSDQHKHRYEVLGHESPPKANKKLADDFAEAARKALSGDLEPLRTVLAIYDERRKRLRGPNGLPLPPPK